MLNYYKTYHEVPIFNFFESEKDISYLLKEQKQIDDAQKLFLETVRNDMQEWFSKEVAESKYNEFISNYSYILDLKRKYLAVETLHQSIKGFNIDVKIEYIFNAENLQKFKKACQDLDLPFREKMFDMQKTLLRFKNAYEARIKMKLVDMEKNTSGNYDYMESVIHLGKDLGFRINPKEVTLYEFAKYLKNVSNGRGN